MAPLIQLGASVALASLERQTKPLGWSARPLPASAAPKHYLSVQQRGETRKRGGGTGGWAKPAEGDVIYWFLFADHCRREKGEHDPVAAEPSWPAASQPTLVSWAPGGALQPGGSRSLVWQQ